MAISDEDKTNTNIEISSSEVDRAEEASGLRVDFVVLDEETPSKLMFVDDDGEDHCMEFTCTRRIYDASMDGHHYHVEPVSEYKDLDFTGHIVMINRIERICHSFSITEEGKLTIFVACTS